MSPCSISFFFFFNDTATTEIYTLSLHDALPICPGRSSPRTVQCASGSPDRMPSGRGGSASCHSSSARSEEHTSELQSRLHLVCRLLLEKKKKKNNKIESSKRQSHIEHSNIHACC